MEQIEGMLKERARVAGRTKESPPSRLLIEGLLFRYGKRLLPDLYAHLNPMRYHTAVEMERDLAKDLQQQGYAVWQA